MFLLQDSASKNGSECCLGGWNRPLLRGIGHVGESGENAHFSMDHSSRCVAATKKRIRDEICSFSRGIRI